MIRRYGGTPQTGQRYGLRAGVYAILPREGAMLMTWQGDPHHELQLPGGGIDPGESPLRALHREVFEETGWTIARPRRLGAFRRFTWMPEYKRFAEKLCMSTSHSPFAALARRASRTTWRCGSIPPWRWRPSRMTAIRRSSGNTFQNRNVSHAKHPGFSSMKTTRQP